MNFEYLNDPEVWDKFCMTYEGILDKMDDFDLWYTVSSETPAPINTSLFLDRKRYRTLTASS